MNRSEASQESPRHPYEKPTCTTYTEEHIREFLGEAWGQITVIHGEHIKSLAGI